MTATSRAAALAVVASALAGSGPARAQIQPPPFEQGASTTPRAPSPTPPPVAAAPPPVQTAPPAKAPPLAQAPPPAQASRPDRRPPASAPSDAEIDDPKVSRRLGTRINVPPPQPTPQPTPAPQPRAATASPSPAAAPPRAPLAAPSPPSPRPVAPLPSARPSPEGDADTPTLVRPYTPPAEATFRPTLPRLKLGLRHFNFVRIGASQSPDGIAATETFNSFGVDVYPVSSGICVGLSSAFGWQSGAGLLDGDYFATQSFSFGGQYRDLGRVVPFAEAFTGVGYMRRLQFARTVPTALWQFGADAGVEVYLARTGYLSFALGYLRPINGFAVRQHFTSVFVDTWSLKVGIGI